MQKATLRQEMLLKRQSYLPAEITARSQQICQQFFKNFPVSGLRTIHVFLPIASKNEVNTWFIIQHLQANFPDIKIAVPVTDGANQTLSHGLLTPETDLQSNKWGIPEPVKATGVTESLMDLVLVPLLAFDEKGHRVGYGKGYYDRFLNLCRPDTISVGLSLEELPVPLIQDIHEGDHTLQFVVTPATIYFFT
ncbi:5-formyltetrahydrofolate cyclo-ligase [Adhaeribacter pallidiroseus]|uniref:5-formyltetrahydrofolate cyclo-ligase n=1 Tax=Adhaeribacter pallidiroseus TaxID=2072847 RepID=A0A369QRS6_9BACT|nr:5-formyltetrahydrofolate cyclo-ligase [Adhaeribacter pallidiroseus]RDC66365.1 5-formyltetrahydrofolate cyclo-ligase [Adhaeribacter pallidiroseus]